MGLLRLFQNEVVFKRVVVQHTLFGSILPKTWEISRPESRNNVQAMGSMSSSSNSIGVGVGVGGGMSGSMVSTHLNLTGMVNRPHHSGGLGGTRPGGISAYSPLIRTTYHLNNPASHPGLGQGGFSASASANAASSSGSVSAHAPAPTGHQPGGSDSLPSPNTATAATTAATAGSGVDASGSTVFFSVAAGMPSRPVQPSDAEALRLANLEKVRAANEAWSKLSLPAPK